MEWRLKEFKRHLGSKLFRCDALCVEQGERNESPTFCATKVRTVDPILGAGSDDQLSSYECKAERRVLD